MLKRILIVDDEIAIADMMEQALLQEGYSARKTTQSLRFYDEVREFRPDLILLDLIMPYLDGGDELRLLALQPDTQNIPVIIITGDANARRRESEYRALGVVQIFIKPVDLNAIITVIHATVGAPGEEVQ